MSTFITISEASRRSGYNAGHVRRLAAAWLAEGKAREICGGGKRKRYEVREDADAEGKFSRVKMPDQLGTDLRQVSDVKRKEAIHRKQILDRWSEAKSAAFTLGFDANAATGRFIEQLLIDEAVEISRGTLYNWERAWREGGLAGLVDGRGKTADGDKPAAEFLEEVKRLYLHKPPLKLTICVQIASLKAEEQGWDVPASRDARYKAAQRCVDAIPKAVLIKHRFGEDAYTNECAPYIQRDYTSMESNEQWCGDHHQFDVMVSCPGADGPELKRPWLTVWQDMRSRKIVGWSISDAAPNTDAILRAFKAGCLEHGIPRGIYIDNGKDYDSYALNGRTKKDRFRQMRIRSEVDVERTDGVFGQLGITRITHAQAYHGQSKPVERFFGTLEQSTPLWPTYCGNKPDNRPDDFQLQIERGNAPKLADFIQWFGDWLCAHNATPSLAQGLDGKSPDAVFAECLARKVTTSRELLDFLCRRRTRPQKVGQNGVNFGGLWFGQYAPELMPLQGKEIVLAVDDEDLSSVIVLSLDGKLICLANSNKMLPANATHAELRVATRENKSHRRLMKQYHEKRMAMSDDLPDAMIRARVAANRSAKQGTGSPPESPVPPPSISPVRSPFESEMPRLQRAIESNKNLRRATGTDDASSFVYSPADASTDESPNSGFVYQRSEE